MREGLERRTTPFSVSARLTTSLRRVELTARRGGNSLAGQPDLRIRFSRAGHSEGERKQPPDNIFLSP